MKIPKQAYTTEFKELAVKLTWQGQLISVSLETMGGVNAPRVVKTSFIRYAVNI